MSTRISAQVLVYQPVLTHSVWTDYNDRTRSVEGLRKQLRKAVERGEYVGYRLLKIEEEHVGATWPAATPSAGEEKP